MAARLPSCSPVLFMLIVLLCFRHSKQQSSSDESSSQWQSLAEIHKLLNYPSALRSFKYSRRGRGICSIEPTPSFTLTCYQGSITQLHITGNTNDFPPLSHDFSSQSFFATIANVSTLKVLSLASLGLWGPIPPSIAQLSSLEILNVSTNYLSGAIPVEISSLRNLQTLILDRNKFTGQVPSWLSSLPLLSVLSLKNNSLHGSLPYSLSSLRTFRVVSLCHYYLFGEVPDRTNLINLQLLDLEDNYFGPHFPTLPNKLVTLVLRKNKFRLGIQTSFSSWYQLQKLDISSNRFVGPFVPALLKLPSIGYLDIGGNKLTGLLSKNMSCNPYLAFVNLSSNLLTGELPSCLKKCRSRVVVYSHNCLANGKNQEQRPSNLCHNQALAVQIPPNKQEHKIRHNAKQVIASSVVSGIVGALLVFGLIFAAFKRS